MSQPETIQPAEPSPDRAPTESELLRNGTNASSVIVPRPAITPLPTPTDQERATAQDVDWSALGSFVVAKPDGGVPLFLPPAGDGSLFEIPVFDEPFGEPRSLVFRPLTELGNDDDFVQRMSLLHRGRQGSPLVLRVVAGGPGDDWYLVQAPTWPHDQAVWVQAEHFTLNRTIRRIEIDLAGDGRLRLFEGGDMMIDSPITKGRSGRETPTHVTYIQSGVTGSRLNANFGPARLLMASFSEVLIEFGEGVLPHNFLQGMTQPDPLDYVSSGSLRLPDDQFESLTARAAPGTPVIIFDSSDEEQNRASVLNRTYQPAETVAFTNDELVLLVTDQTGGERLWRLCGSAAATTCRDKAPLPRPRLPVGNTFIVAPPDAGEWVPEIGKRVIHVYDVPGGEQRMLADRNPVVPELQLQYPLHNPTAQDQPLTLRVVQGAPGDAWVLVQAPIRPHRQAVWVSTEGFEFRETTKRIEVDLADGELTLLGGDTELLTSLTVYGRDSRPTTEHDTYVEQRFEGARFNPAYGAYILTLASYSEALASFGGGGMPGQSLHGTNQPELVGQRVSSGGIRVGDEVITKIYNEPNIVGASVVIFNSRGLDRVEAINRERNKPWSPALTIPLENARLAEAPEISYS